MAITVREIVDDQLEDLAGSGAQVARQISNLGHGVEPSEGGDQSNLGDLSFESRIGDHSGGSVNFAGIIS